MLKVDIRITKKSIKILADFIMFAIISYYMLNIILEYAFNNFPKTQRGIISNQTFDIISIVFPIVFIIYIIGLIISIFLKDKSTYNKFNFILEIIFLFISIVNFFSFFEIKIIIPKSRFIIGYMEGTYNQEELLSYLIDFNLLLDVLILFLPILYFLYSIKNFINECS